MRSTPEVGYQFNFRGAFLFNFGDIILIWCYTGFSIY